MADPAAAIRSEEDRPDFAAGCVNLASPRIGASVIHATDEFFAPSERMLNDAPPVFYPDLYDDNGKWMDGWETRRRRDGGNDWCILRLGATGTIAGVDLNTRFFTGNHPPRARIEAALCDGDPDKDTVWTELIPVSSLSPDTRNLFPVAPTQPVSHLRLSIYPDGGIARFRVWGNPACEWKTPDADGRFELSAIVNGGRVIGYNNAHYGDPWIILTPGRGINMGDGWETRRRREPGNDWIVVALGTAGLPERIEIDTAHFKGNYPDRCSIQAAFLANEADAAAVAGSDVWPTVMAEQKLQADHVHVFEGDSVAPAGPVTHVRLNIFPDGGISRFRLFGKLVEEP